MYRLNRMQGFERLKGLRIRSNHGDCPVEWRGGFDSQLVHQIFLDHVIVAIHDQGNDRRSFEFTNNVTATPSIGNTVEDGHFALVHFSILKVLPQGGLPLSEKLFPRLGSVK